MVEVKKGPPLYEQIYEVLKEAIVTGKYKPGERLVDYRISKELQVSRSPVREAFRKLEQEGLLLNQDGNTTVYAPNIKDVLELFQVRIGLESVAAYWATKWMNEDEIKELKQILDGVKQAIADRDMEEVVRLNTRFHDFIVCASRNKRLKEMIGKIESLILLYRNTFFRSYDDGSDDYLKEHEEIYEAIRSKNANLASLKMQDHLMNDMEALKRKIANEPELQVEND